MTGFGPWGKENPAGFALLVSPAMVLIPEFWKDPTFSHPPTPPMGSSVRHTGDLKRVSARLRP